MEHRRRAKISSYICRRHLVSDDKRILSGLFDMEHVAQMKSSRLIPQLCQEAYCVSPPHLFTTAISEKKQACMQALVSVNKRQSLPPEDEIGQISPQCRRGRGTNTANAPRTAQPGAERNPGQVEGGDNTESIPTSSRTMRTVIRLPQTAESGAVVADILPTPAGQRDPGMTNLRLSNSPTRVSGTRVSLGTQFAACCSGDRVCVDKTLVCKGFWDEVDGTSRICLPRRSGKTFNLQLLRLFFSPLPELKCLNLQPDSTDADYVITLSRTTRESFFDESLLKKLHSDFYAEHFMKHAVICISFDSCNRRSFGGMIMDLCKAIARTAKRHLGEFKYFTKPVNPDVQNAEKSLRTYLETAEKVGNMSEDDAARYGGLPSTLFSALSRFVYRQYGAYILLLDEYDIPFLSLLEGTLDEASKVRTSAMLGGLFQDMFKGNDEMHKGLMTGVFE
ncbi:hypothetical protein GGI17_005987, partial [Coemansia sp. S146]